MPMIFTYFVPLSFKNCELKQMNQSSVRYCLTPGKTWITATLMWYRPLLRPRLHYCNNYKAPWHPY